NKCISKSGDRCVLERILYKLKDGGSGRFPTYYYKGMRIIVDIKKEDVDRVTYCDRCMIYVKDDDSEGCPKCGNIHSYCIGYKIKFKKMYLHGDGDVSENYIKKYGNELIEHKRGE
ncbi:MAG: hypothetical protein ACRDD7_09310, partial [Peptostreptococcaceae bacterium]